jgi:hypothetical protein
LLFIFLFLLILGAQFAGISSLYGNLPATNVTKITTNIANGVVTASGFTPLIYLGFAIAIVSVAIALAIVAFKRFGGSD